MRRRALLTLAAYLLTVATGCARLNDSPWAEIKGKRYTVELADTPETRERGLMFRRELAPDAGMLFIHDDAEPLAYWMKNTYIPLDILYFDRDRRLVSAQLGVLPCGRQPQCPIYPSAGPAKYVLELNAGEAQGLALKPGDELRFGGFGADNRP